MAIWIAVELDKISDKELAKYAAQGGKVKVLTDDPKELPALNESFSRKFTQLKAFESGVITASSHAKSFL